MQVFDRVVALGPRTEDRVARLEIESAGGLGVVVLVVVLTVAVVPIAGEHRAVPVVSIDRRLVLGRLVLAEPVPKPRHELLLFAR